MRLGGRLSLEEGAAALDASMRSAAHCLISDRTHTTVRGTFNYRNDYGGVEQWSRTIHGGNYVYLASLHQPATDSLRSTNFQPGNS